MVFILAIHWRHYPPKKKIVMRRNFIQYRALVSIRTQKNPEKNVQNTLSIDLKDKKDVVIWHDVLNKSISKHGSNNVRALSVSDFIETFKTPKDKLALCSGVLPTCPHSVQYRRIEGIAN